MTEVCGQIKQKGMGGPGAPDVAWQTDSYIFGSSGEGWYSPLFTFHVFRYMEIKGLDYKPELSDARGMQFHTNVNSSGSFTCSSELLNSIQDASRRTFRDNLISVQSDCPGREKFGYGGDLNATADAFLNNFDMHSFYIKTLYDWVDAMSDTSFIDTAPYVKLAYCGISWESAFIITQYKLLLYYNDTSLVRQMYDKDLKWMEKAARIHPEGVVDKGLADHESLEKVPVPLIGTTHYLDCARIMKQFAALMKDEANEEKFGKLEAKLEKAVRELYWERSVPDTLNRQTLFATLLYYDIVPENDRQRAVDSLLKALKKAPAGHFTTGIFGTKYALEALSSAGYTGTVFNIVNSKAFPGWGHMIDRGATTIWETWKESDNVYSNCHPMFGSVSEWFYRWLGGIRPDPLHPGFTEFVIGPSVPEGLSRVKCSYQAPMGLINSDWEKISGGIKFSITVPANSKALFIFPDKRKNTAMVLSSSTGKSEKTDLTKNDFKLSLEPGDWTIIF
jgi:alpha-L-rhamnosidase